jgi:hypothetical protein
MKKSIITISLTLISLIGFNQNNITSKDYVLSLKEDIIKIDDIINTLKMDDDLGEIGHTVTLEYINKLNSMKTDLLIMITDLSCDDGNIYKLSNTSVLSQLLSKK